MGVFAIAGLGVLLVLFLILVLRLHPLVALLCGSLSIMLATPEEPRQRLAVRDSTHEVAAVVDGQIGVREQLADGSYALWEQSAGILSADTVELRKSTQAARPPSGEESSESPARDAELFWYEITENETEIDVSRRYSLVDQASLDAIVGTRLSRLGSEMTYGFAKTFSRLGIPVTMAAIVGICLLESGAAARLILLVTGLFGPRGTTPAMTVSSFVLGVPVYFDNVFYLLLPLAKAIGRRQSELFLSAVMAIIVGATMAHSLVPPTPGPLLVADLMGVSVLQMMLGGLCVGGAAALVGYLYGRICQSWVSFTPEQLAASLEQDDTNAAEPDGSEKKVPVLLAILPIGLPILLLASAELTTYLYQDVPKAEQPSWLAIMSVAKNPSLVFILTALVAILILRAFVTREKAISCVSKAITDAGMIVLLTCAGGAFGYSLQQLDLAGAIGSSFEGIAGPWALLCTAFFLTTIIRAAQGSATVAMITSASIISPVLSGDMSLPYHKLYLALAIGCGSKPLPWMNDSGFWQVATMTGMTPVQTLKSFSMALTLMGLTGFGVTLLGAYLFPLVGS
ncbi:MAG TPA: hypothetical protein DDW52_09845 [Planctomycetaceae bacterium]|nr:hypothetical protein [Planctomycetaceae bacterium]